MVSGVVREIRIYVEGGGNQAETRAQFRNGINQFLTSLRECARSKNIRWQIVACGGRQGAFNDFCTALKTHPDALNILLVDAEATVTGRPWQHLKARDNWTQPRRVSDDQCHLMVQSMESWFVADINALTDYYQQGFIPNALPKQADIELVDRHLLADTLDRATRGTTKVTYHKIRHGAELLKRVNPAKVRAASRHCDALFTTLAAKMGGC